jgi:hypothetical protein
MNSQAQPEGFRPAQLCDPRFARPPTDLPTLAAAGAEFRAQGSNAYRRMTSGGANHKLHFAECAHDYLRAVHYTWSAASTILGTRSGGYCSCA